MINNKEAFSIKIRKITTDKYCYLITFKINMDSILWAHQSLKSRGKYHSQIRIK